MSRGQPMVPLSESKQDPSLLLILHEIMTVYMTYFHFIEELEINTKVPLNSNGKHKCS